MNLYLLRHGIAVEHGAAGYPDAERPLTRNGRNKLRCVAAALKRMEVKFDMIISSPLARARQTAELVARQLNATKSVTISRHLEPGSRIPGAVRHLHRLKTKPKNILLLGALEYESNKGAQGRNPPAHESVEDDRLRLICTFCHPPWRRRNNSRCLFDAFLMLSNPLLITGSSSSSTVCGHE